MNALRLLKSREKIVALGILFIVVVALIVGGSAIQQALTKEPRITRAQLAKEAITAYSIPVLKSQPRHFIDVPKSNKSFDYIETAYKYDIVKPVKKSVFKPYAYADKKTVENALFVASKLNVTLFSKDDPRRDLPKWTTPEIEEALDKIVASFSGKKSTDRGYYETIPRDIGLREKANAEQQSQQKPDASLLGGAPEWFDAAKKISVTGKGTLSLKDYAGVKITDVNEGTIAYMAHNSGQYVARLGDKYYQSGKPLRLSAEPGSFVELPDYKDIGYDNTTNYNKFRGDVIVEYSQNSKTLWAVNELPVEEYLKGLAEGAAGDSTEYLKSLTVASRSYAHYYLSAGGKHKGEPFHLKNSRNRNGNDQVYAGFAFEGKVANMAQAVDETNGTVATYNGKAIRLPYSAGTDGKRTRSAKEVYGVDDMPWAQSVADPNGYISNWKTLEGNHMVGLSAQGARGYIDKEKKTFDWVLNYYFKDISLAKEDSQARIKIGIFSVS